MMSSCQTRRARKAYACGTPACTSDLLHLPTTQPFTLPTGRKLPSPCHLQLCQIICHPGTLLCIRAVPVQHFPRGALPVGKEHDLDLIDVALPAKKRTKQVWPS